METARPERADHARAAAPATFLSSRPQPPGEIDRAGVVVLGDVVNDPLEESPAGVVADEHPCGEPLYASASRPSGEPLGQGAADSTVLPRVDDHDGDLRLLEILRAADEAGNSHDLAAGGVDCHEGLVHLVVDVRQEGELWFAQVVDRSEETSVARDLT